MTHIIFIKKLKLFSVKIPQYTAIFTLAYGVYNNSFFIQGKIIPLWTIRFVKFKDRRNM